MAGYRYQGSPPPPMPSKKRGRPLSPLTVCGTVGGYARHYRDKTLACLPCKAANAEACRRTYLAKKAAS